MHQKVKEKPNVTFKKTFLSTKEANTHNPFKRPFEKVYFL